MLYCLSHASNPSLLLQCFMSFIMLSPCVEYFHVLHPSYPFLSLSPVLLIPSRQSPIYIHIPLSSSSAAAAAF
jgi:hypothetical protein